MKFFYLLIFIFYISDISAKEINDPYENLNRKTYEFNENLDEKIAKPIAEFYSKFPPPIKLNLALCIINHSF